MKTAFQTSRRPFASGFKDNALLHLIFFTAVCYIIIQALGIILMAVKNASIPSVMNEYIIPNMGIRDWNAFIHKPWTVFTYFLGHVSFWNMVVNMVWLYAFGTIVQSLIGHREIMPLYFISSIVSGIVFCCFSYAWPQIDSSVYVMSAQAGTMAMAVAALTIAPSYRYFLGDQLSIPLVLVFAIYLILNVAAFAYGNFSLLILLAFAALTGYGYMRMLQNGMRPGKWIYNSLSRLENNFTPDAEKIAISNNIIRKQALQNAKKQTHYSQEYIDTILDKINSKGYDSLTAEEKEVLFKASRDEF